MAAQFSVYKLEYLKELYTCCRSINTVSIVSKTLTISAMISTGTPQDHKAILQKCQDKKLVFTVTPGRSGTGFLQALLDLPESTTSLHEPDPQFVLVMRACQNDRRLAYNFLVNSKLPAIANCSTRVYVETSHLFCKGFFELLLKLGITPDLIILRRSHRKVAKSMVSLGTIPGRTLGGLNYYLTPDDPGVLPLPHWQLLNNYQLCYWYCLEIERRMKYYSKISRDRDAAVIETSATNLMSIDAYKSLLQQLEIPFNETRVTPAHKAISDTLVNQKTDEKWPVSFNDTDLDTYEQEVLEKVRDFCPDVMADTDR